MNQHGWKDKGSIYNEGISIDGKAEDEYITKGGMRRMSKGPQYEGERDVQKDLALSVEKAIESEAEAARDDGSCDDPTS